MWLLKHIRDHFSRNRAQVIAVKTVSDFSKDMGPPAGDGRLDAPAFHRNGEPLCAVVTELVSGRSGDVVEIGSGTGQHAALLASRLPDLTFWPTDPLDVHVRSIDAWQQQSGCPNLQPATQLDVRDLPWRLAGKPLVDRSLTAILCVNVIHIAPWDVALAVLDASARFLRPDGLLILYGPYMRNGVHTAPSNEAFDRALKERNPEWGVRDLEVVTRAAQETGLVRHAVFEMPANNLTVVFRQRP